jgi:hypothetical protein
VTKEETQEPKLRFENKMLKQMPECKGGRNGRVEITA